MNYEEKQYLTDKQQFWTKKVTEKMDKFISKNADKLTFSQIMKMPIEERMRHLSPSQILKFQNKDLKGSKDMKFAEDEEEAFRNRVNNIRNVESKL